jgi:hypothetical protein
MAPQVAIAAEIARLDGEIAKLEADREVLRRAASLLAGKAGPTFVAPRTREQTLLELVATAGEMGLSRRECIEQMRKVCDSPPASISTMLNRLQAQRQIRNVNGRWVAALRAA